MDSSSTAESRISGRPRAQKPALEGSSRRTETAPTEAARGPWALVPVAVEEPAAAEVPEFADFGRWGLKRKSSEDP
jgi:hypothetical protein